MTTKKLFNRNFTLMVIGQIISLFGNSILRFALSLYILDVTGSAAVFGTILALSMIPTILLSPVGGVLADRVNRRNIMVCLDFSTSALCVILFTQLGSSHITVMVGGFMMILAVIQSFYQPSVQSSIPVLVDSEHLLAANGVAVQVNALANLIGPVLGGMLYGFFGLKAIVIVSICAFFASAVMEIFIQIPFKRQQRQGSAVSMVVSDLGQAVRFLGKENPVLLKILLVVAAINMFFSTMIMVGFPFIVKIQLGLSSQLYGFVEGAMAVGSIGAGLLSGLIAHKLNLKKSWIFIVLGGVAILPVVVAELLSLPALGIYGVLLVCSVACMLSVSMFTIYAQAFMQGQTPNVLMGKVSAFVSTICMCAYPLGQALYGLLFDKFSTKIFGIVLFAVVVEMLLGVLTRFYLAKLPDGGTVDSDMADGGTVDSDMADGGTANGDKVDGETVAGGLTDAPMEADRMSY